MSRCASCPELTGKKKVKTRSSGVRWTPEEINQLVELYGDTGDMSNHRITSLLNDSIGHERSVTAVSMAIHKLYKEGIIDFNVNLSDVPVNINRAAAFRNKLKRLINNDESCFEVNIISKEEIVILITCEGEEDNFTIGYDRLREILVLPGKDGNAVLTKVTENFLYSFNASLLYDDGPELNNKLRTMTGLSRKDWIVLLQYESLFRYERSREFVGEANVFKNLLTIL